MGRRHRIGRRGEVFAARTLRERGWRILARNWRAGHAELDLVARKGGIVAFVEVKTRTGSTTATPLESVTAPKRREVERAAAAWIRAHGSELGGVEVFRFDAVSVRIRLGKRVGFRHVADAWRIGED